jgi:Z1 domain
MATDKQWLDAENLLTAAISRQGEMIDTSVISKFVEEFRPVRRGSIYDIQESDFKKLIKSLEARFETTMDKGSVLIDGDYHDEDWYKPQGPESPYWDDYTNHLIQEGWAPRVIQSLDTVTNTILGLLQNPLQAGEWERRGLVIGHVQSGKTANYIGLISKAAGAGYKFIIVIAGIHNELRRQTQERIDRGFIGRNSVTKELIGVGLLNPERAFPVTITTTESDFNRTASRNFGVGLNAVNKTFILIIKKNTNTLSHLYTWLKELNTRKGFEQITDIPMLMIDDEADNASINTNRPELDPTKINSEIRRILNLFRKKCYLGYTATPFANIFIDPASYNHKHGSDLFPKHFIYCLEAPSNYLGYERIFLEDKGQKDFIRMIEDADNWLPANHKKDMPVYELPSSLKRAIHLFVLARAVRNLRVQTSQHCSMLVNVSKFVTVQNEIHTLINQCLRNLRNAVRYNYRSPWEQASKDSIISELYRVFQDEYAMTGVNWQEVLHELNNAANVIEAKVINSHSQEKLLYTEYNRSRKPLTVIAIGGLSLSRGLTLEGLTISYIHRSTKMYDTLLQMGRWFGYRPDYEDLCRIFMAQPSYEWYAHIADATEELRHQVKRMRRERKEPIDFGLYVKSHPDTLTVTAANKMYHTESHAFNISYDGKLFETYILPSDQEKTENNRKLIHQMFKSLEGTYRYNKAQSHIFFDVQWERVEDYVLAFQFHADLEEDKNLIVRYIKTIADIYPQWDMGFVSLQNRQPEDDDIIAAQQRTVGYINGNIKTPISEPGWYTGNKNRFSANNMFKIGFTDEQLARASAEAKEEGRNDPSKMIYRDYTNGRGKPLLLVHLLNLMDQEKVEQGRRIPAMSISFPNSKQLKTVDYIVGPVWLKQFKEGQQEIQEEEDDFEPLD